MDDILNNKNVLVTGSTSGIGLGIAEKFAAAGANIAINGLGDQPAIDQAAAKVDVAGNGKVIFAAADLTKSIDIDAMFQQIEAELGIIDILVNCAGVQYVAPVEDFPLHEWDKIIAINLSAAFKTIRLALPAMKQKGWGRIINIASVHALVASKYKSAYVAAKHGIAGLTKTVALELAETHITVNAIAPGFVDTPLVEKQLDAAATLHGTTRDQVFQDVVVASQPSGRLVGVEEIAAMALYLCGDHAASLTGAVLPVDGGWTAR